MDWFRSLGSLEVIFILTFVALYLIFLFRVIRIAKRMNTSYRRVFYKIFIRTLYFALLIIALLGPSFGEASREIKSIGKDIFICVDLSESMNAFDIQPTRIERVKYELKNVIEAFSSDRIGLIIFSSEAFMQCPLTYDQSALYLFLETLSVNLVPNTGTDFGPPLRMALDKLTEESTSPREQKSKIIILISDGEDFGEETDEVAEEIQDANIKLFTLGVGTETGSKIRTRTGHKIDRTGQEVITRLNPDELKSLAIKTEGKYFEINESRNDVDRLINTLNEIEGDLRDTRIMDVSSNKYYYFLAAALLLIMFDIITGIRTIKV